MQCYSEYGNFVSSAAVGVVLLILERQRDIECDSGHMESDSGHGTLVSSSMVGVVL
jgi:hypothetical protein